MNNVNLNSLRIFYEVATAKSFLDASNKLFISQPAISKSISKLEEELNITLFYRANKGITLTSSGELLYNYLKDIRDSLLSCERVLVSMNNIEEGKIIIGVQSHIVRNYLMDKIDSFRSKHPKVLFELIDLPTNELIEKLEDRKVDFVIDSTPINTVYNNIEIEPICSLSTTFVKSVNNKNIIENLEDLEEENLILPAKRGAFRRNLNKCFNNAGIQINKVLEFETEELIIEAVRRNLGVGYVVKSAIKYLVDDKILEYVNIEEKLPEMEINLVYIKNNLTNISKLFITEEINKEV